MFLHTALQRLIDKLDKRHDEKHQTASKLKRNRINSELHLQCLIPDNAPSWAVNSSARPQVISVLMKYHVTV